MSTPETAAQRLNRLLTMVPWLVTRQGIELDAAATELGISVEQLEADLNLLFLCGYGQLPDELIDADWESGRVFISNAEAIERPLRLAGDEAVALIVALRALREVPGVGDADALERTLAKLERAAGPAGASTQRVVAQLGDPGTQDMLARVRAVVESGHRVRLRYLNPARDEITERDVDPLRVIGVDGNWYLEGYCYRAGAMRRFRVDRIEDLTPLDVEVDPGLAGHNADLSGGVYRPGPGDINVTLRVDPAAAWMADFYPVESVQVHGDGSLRVVMAVSDPAWVARLVAGMGGHVRVEDPPEVAAEIRRRAQEALAAYPTDRQGGDDT